MESGTFERPKDENLLISLRNTIKSDKKGVVNAPIPSRTIQRGLFDKSILVFLLVSKFVDHLPLHRQKQMQLDNNLIENAIRPMALGRKKRNVAPYLFAGTHETAQNAAKIYSLFPTCKKHKVNPNDWLPELLRKLNDINYEGKFSDLLPYRWKTS